MATTYGQDTWVWVPDEEHIVLPGRITKTFHSGQPGDVILHRLVPSGQGLLQVDEPYTIPAAQTKNLERMDPNSVSSLENMVNLRSLSESSILHNLRLRFAENQIYTSVGSILISVNPFKLLQLYTAEMLEAYKVNGYRNMPPHVYSIADAVYQNMTQSGLNQSCIVSGESGAGKTEATKIFLQYIADVSSQAGKNLNVNAEIEKKSAVKEQASLQEQILKANPLMEAFGNAKTVRNNNSSRFGKWIEIEFNNKKGTIIGGQIVQYLLEKSRIVAQQEGERNYHIFYQLCAGAAMDSKVRDKFRITDPRDYAYLNAGGEGSLVVDGINDDNDWEDVLQSMAVMNISNEEQDYVLRTLSGILHLGNIAFQQDAGKSTEGAKVTNTDMLELTASQFGVKPEALNKALISEVIDVGREKAERHLSVPRAEYTRDALAKTLYSSLFDWLIDRINKTLDLNSSAIAKEAKKLQAQDKSIIGVLDIFGFESFRWNSLEQLMINYTNERLAKLWNQVVFMHEQAIYKAEGIDVSNIAYEDNTPVLNLFEDKTNGIFSILDEVMFTPTSNTDESFLKKLSATLKDSKKLNGEVIFLGPGVKTTYERNSFTVTHYAGKVMYNVTGFLDKNSDKVSDDLSGLIAASASGFIASLMVDPNASKEDQFKGRGRKKGASLGSKFKAQLNLLMDKLNHTQPEFIRCIKPNAEKQGNIFTAQMVMDQLRYAGLLQVCEIRKVGYPIRRDFKEFLFRYAPLADQKLDRKASDMKPQVKKLTATLTSQGLMPPSEFQVGKTKVFLRANEVDVLEAKREIALRKYAVLGQKVFRGYIDRKKYRYFIQIRKNLQAAMSKRDLNAIRKAIEDYGELPFGGRHLKDLPDAKKLMENMEENLRMITMLKDAVTQRDIDKLKSALNAAEVLRVVDGYKEKEIAAAKNEVKALIERIQAEKKAVADLKAAMNERDLSKLTACLQTMQDMGLGNAKECQQADILRVKLEEEHTILRSIEAAMEQNNLEGLQEALNRANENGLEEHVVVQKGREHLKELVKTLETDRQAEILEEEERIQNEAKKKKEEKVKVMKEKLIKAVGEQNFDVISNLKAEALEIGMKKDELDSIFHEVDQHEKVKENSSALIAAMATLRQLALNKNGITLQDINYLSGVIDMARSNGLAEDKFPTLAEAVKLEENMHKRFEVQENLSNAVQEPVDYPSLRQAVDAADELNLSLDVLEQARDLLKDHEMDHPETYDSRVGRSADNQTQGAGHEISETEFEAQRKQNMELAAHIRYDFTKFYKIRSPADYTRGILFNKRRVADSQLTYQETVIPKSILNLYKRDLNKMAVAIHKSLLGYCGEISMSFPATLAQDILEKGLNNPELVDEIYIQICKHLNDNFNPESVGRAWQLMCMAVGTFPPSKEFDYYLMNFLIQNTDTPGLVGNYATYSLRRLEGMMIRGASGFVPSLDEILAYKQRPPVLCTIELVDGTHLTEDLPIPPDLNVERVVEICTHFLSLTDTRSSQFGIYVQEEPLNEQFDSAIPESGYSAMRMNNITEVLHDLPPPPPLQSSPTPPETPRPLRGSDFVGDVVVATTRKRVNYTFIFKKKLFVPGDKENSDDPVYKRLIYLQAADEVIRGNILISDVKDLLFLTAIGVKNDLPTENGKQVKFPSEPEKLLELDLLEYIPVNWVNKKTPENWAREVAQQRGKVASTDNAKLEVRYVNLVSSLPLWGLNFFFVREQLDGSDMICGVGFEGLHFYSLRRELIRTHKFELIERWGGSSTQFWVMVWNEERRGKVKVSLFTSQAKDISNLILDYAKLRNTLENGDT